METPTREHEQRPADAPSDFEPAATATKRRMLIIVNPYARDRL